MSERFNFTDSVMGNWNMLNVPDSSGGNSPGYDTLNRLVAMQNTGTTSTSSQYAGQYLCWSYDTFGNRTQQVQQSTPCAGSGPSSSNSVLNYNSSNQLSTVTPPGGGSPSPSPLNYDQAGSVLFDGGTGNTYLYDAEGRNSTPRTKTCPRGPRFSTPRTKTCPRGPRFSTPRTKTC
ncbi:MAG: hypothetical protein ABSG96_24630, partial [Terracidiphilus sp.]